MPWTCRLSSGRNLQEHGRLRGSESCVRVELQRLVTANRKPGEKKKTRSTWDSRQKSLSDAPAMSFSCASQVKRSPCKYLTWQWLSFFKLLLSQQNVVTWNIIFRDKFKFCFRSFFNVVSLFLYEAKSHTIFRGKRRHWTTPVVGCESKLCGRNQPSSKLPCDHFLKYSQPSHWRAPAGCC